MLYFWEAFQTNSKLQHLQPIFIYYCNKIYILDQTDFKWKGAGQQVFGSSKPKEVSRDSSSGTDAHQEEEFDPHYEPIVPLPKEIAVTTGEEDEVKCKAVNIF